VSAVVNNTPLLRACQIAKNAGKMSEKSCLIFINQPVGTPPPIVRGNPQIRQDAEIRTRPAIRFVANSYQQGKTIC
jgi:hypothetical protein